MLYVDQPPQGLLNLFRFPATDLAPPKWVGENTQAYAVETLVDTFQGAGALDRIIDDLADRPNGPGIHLKKDILDQLSGKFYMANMGVSNLEQGIPKLMFSIGVRNTKTTQDFIAKMLKQDGVKATTRTFQGETIVEFEAPNNVTPGLCVVNDSILVSSDVSLVEQAIRGDRAQKPLAESPMYRQIAKAFPEKVSIVSFQRASESHLRSRPQRRPEQRRHSRGSQRLLGNLAPIRGHQEILARLGKLHHSR